MPNKKEIAWGLPDSGIQLGELLYTNVLNIQLFSSQSLLSPKCSVPKNSSDCVSQLMKNLFYAGIVTLVLKEKITL